MSNSEASIAVSARPRGHRVWKIVAAVAISLAAVPVAAGVGAWAAGHLSSGNAASTTPKPVRN